MKFKEYTAKSAEDVLNGLQTSKEGITEKEAEIRFKVYGLNEVKMKRNGAWGILLRQFKSPFFYLLFVASAIAFGVGELINSLMILFFVVINVSLGFFQEYRAEKAVHLLKRYFPSKARVLRNNIEKKIEKNLLVPGDIVLLEAGDIAPADIRLLRGSSLLIDETLLTGESIPVSKTSNKLSEEAKDIFGAKNIIFSGTSIVSGEAMGVVVATANNSVMGGIAKMISGKSKESVYEKSILRFSKIIMRTVVITIVFIFLANLIIKGTSNFFDFLIFSIALIISIIPEALPVVISFALSEGALRLAKEKVVVRRLSAVEGLGDIEILCTDKTGTLTENKLELVDIYSKDKEKCLLYGLYSSSYVKEDIESTENPFDLALKKVASKKMMELLKEVKILMEVPFDSVRMRNGVLLQDSKKKILIVKGAPEVILKLCSEGVDKRAIKKEIEKQGKEGKRVLVIAYKDFNKNRISEKDEKKLTFAGYFSFKDPLKKTAKDAIQTARNLNLQIKIVTGDGKEVAGAVAKEVGLIENSQDVILGEKLNSLNAQEFEKACQDFSVFARISPETKYKIVECLQKKYEVGFLGEGINDTPALKIANVAIVVPSVADISREVSDIILLKKDLNIIINGIKKGRKIFSNINKYIKCTIASNFGNFYSIALISLFIPFLPMLPVQILLVNLLSDFPLIAVVYDRVDSEELKKPKMYQLNQFVLLIFLLALTSIIFDFIFFGIFRNVEPSMLQTLWFIESILTEIFFIFSIRSVRFFAKAKMPSISLMVISALVFLTTIGLPFTKFGKDIFFFVSPPIGFLGIVMGLIILYFIASETVKLNYFKYWHKN